MKVMIKIWDVIEQDYCHDENTGELILYNSEEECKEMLRKEGWKESVIENGFEYHQHLILDESGYELQ